MGRVIKGSPESAGFYTVGVPAHVAPVPSHVAPEPGRDDMSSATGAGSPAFTVGHSPDPDVSKAPAEPGVDLEAAGAQAKKLVADATGEADALVEAARKRAHDVLEEARGQARTIVDDTRRNAHDEGYAAGAASAHDEAESMLTVMRDLVEATRSERHVLISAAEPELVRLAVAIAERVLHGQIALDHGVVVEMAKAAISRIVDREKITVRVNPSDVEAMREHRDELLTLGDVKTMRVIEDQRVDHGGVIIETDAGSIDAKISTQLAEVRKILHIVDDVVVEPAPAPHVGAPDIRAAKAS